MPSFLLFTLCLLGTWSDVTSHEVHSGVCFLRDVVYMFTSGKVVTYGTPRYFESDFWLTPGMDEVVLNWIFLIMMHKTSHFSALQAICHFFSAVSQ